MFCKKRNTKRKASVVTLHLLNQLKYWMYKEQEIGNPFLQLLLMIIDLSSS